MIDVSGLTKRYGQVTAIEDVTFRVERGEVIGFLGPNGAGKTTTMRILAGFTPATAGTAQLAGFDVSEQPLEVKRRVGYLPENVPLYPEMRVKAFLAYVTEVKGLDAKLRLSEIDRVIEQCGLQEVINRVLGHVSKGYRQRVGLAQALIGAPPILILDEPTVGLDPRQIIEIRHLIRNLAAAHTVLLSTHILPEATMLCERVVIINQGRVIAQDSVANLAGAGRELELHEVEVSGPVGGIVETLRAVDGVDRVYEERPGRYLVAARTDREVREDLARAVVQKGWGLQALRRRARTLEDIFVEAISSEKATACEEETSSEETADPEGKASREEPAATGEEPLSEEPVAPTSEETDSSKTGGMP